MKYAEKYLKTFLNCSRSVESMFKEADKEIHGLSEFNKGTPPTLTTGVGLQKVRKSDPVLVLSNDGIYGVCTYDGESYTMMSKALCGDFQMIRDDIVDPNNIVGWRSL